MRTIEEQFRLAEIAMLQKQQQFADDSVSVFDALAHACVSIEDAGLEESEECVFGQNFKHATGGIHDLQAWFYDGSCSEYEV